MIYFDSAYIARCYLPEPGHAEVAALAASSPQIACAEIARIEVASVFHRKLREGAISPKSHRELCLQFDDDIAAGVWIFLPVTASLLTRAQSTYQRLPATVFLRSADCLHLCAASEAGFKEIYSNDRHLLAAAAHFGLRPVNVIPVF
jgi:predicted nucleic acid-binding protein